MNRVNRINRVNCMLARIGILGGILFSIGDALLFLTPHFDSEHDARLDWDAMPVWRFGLSALVGIAGMFCLLCGVLSMYRAIRERCGRVICTTWLIGIGGTVLTAFGHFTLGAWEPLQYKAMKAAGLAAEQITQIISAQMPWIYAIDAVTVLLLTVQFISFQMIVFSGKLGCPKWMFLLGNYTMTAIGFALYVPLRMIGLQGLCGGFESLGEGLMYLIPLLYWKKKGAD